MLKGFRHSRILINGIKLLSATSVSQFVAVLAFPLITRLYEPDSIGQLSFFLVLVGIGSILASAQYENAIMIEPDNRNASALVDLSFLLALAACLLFFAIACLALHFLDASFQFLLLVAPLTLLSSLGWILSFWWNRNNRFGRSASYLVIQSLASTGMKLILGFLHFCRWGLFVASFVGQAVALFSLLRNKPKPETRLFQFSSYRMRYVAKKHFAFPKYTLPHRLLNIVVNNLPILVLPLVFNMAEVGFFALALSVSLKPIWALARSANQVLFQRIGENRRNDVRCYRQVCRFSLNMIRIAIPLLLIVFIVLPHATPLLFGNGWEQTGRLLQIMLPWILTSSLVQTLNFIPLVYSEQRKAFFFEIASALIQCCALAVGLYIGNLTITITLLACAVSLFSVSQLWWFFWLLRRNQDCDNRRIFRHA